MSSLDYASFPPVKTDTAVRKASAGAHGELEQLRALTGEYKNKLSLLLKRNGDLLAKYYAMNKQQLEKHFSGPAPKSPVIPKSSDATQKRGLPTPKFSRPRIEHAPAHTPLPAVSLFLPKGYLERLEDAEEPKCVPRMPPARKQGSPRAKRLNMSLQTGCGCLPTNSGRFLARRYPRNPRFVLHYKTVDESSVNTKGKEEHKELYERLHEETELPARNPLQNPCLSSDPADSVSLPPVKEQPQRRTNFFALEPIEADYPAVNEDNKKGAGNAGFNGCVGTEEVSMLARRVKVHRAPLLQQKDCATGPSGQMVEIQFPENDWQQKGASRRKKTPVPPRRLRAKITTRCARERDPGEELGEIVRCAQLNTTTGRRNGILALPLEEEPRYVSRQCGPGGDDRLVREEIDEIQSRIERINAYLGCAPRSVVKSLGEPRLVRELVRSCCREGVSNNSVIFDLSKAVCASQAGNRHDAARRARRGGRMQK